jgi:hypothetical protein
MTRKPNKDPVRALAKTMVCGNYAWVALSEGSKKFWLSEARLDIAALDRRGFQVVRKPPVERGHVVYVDERLDEVVAAISSAFDARD